MSQDACGWCGELAVTSVVVVPGRKNKRYQPVCETHAVEFESRGLQTQRLEQDALTKREQERAEYMTRNMPWLNRKGES